MCVGRERSYCSCLDAPLVTDLGPASSPSSDGTLVNHTFSTCRISSSSLNHSFHLDALGLLLRYFQSIKKKKINGLKEKTEHLGRLYEYGNHIFWVQKWNFYYLLLSRVQLFVTPWIVAHQASLSITISWSLLKLMSIESVMPSNQLILCRPLLLPPSICPSIRVLSHESVPHIRWSKYWSFSFRISPFNEYSGFISFRIDQFDLLVVSLKIQ